MRLVAWNCNGKFRDKYSTLDDYFKADIYIISECENPMFHSDTEFRTDIGGVLFTGEKNRGIGVFAGRNHKIEKIELENPFLLRYYLPFRIDGKINMIAVWACDNYIEDAWIYFKLHEQKLPDFSSIAGDFNSNAVWDRKHKHRTHSSLVQNLRRADFVSCYHHHNNCPHGQETFPTFYMHRNLSKPYHIDYIFLKDGLPYRNFDIGDMRWLKYSDHLPLMVDIDIVAR